MWCYSLAIDALCKELVSRKIINGEQLEDIKHISDAGNLIVMLIEKGYVTPDTMATVLKHVFFIDFANIADYLAYDKSAISLPHFVAFKHKMILLGMFEGVWHIAISNPFDFYAVEDAESVLNCPVKAVFASPGDIKYHLDKLYGAESMGNIVSEFLEDGKSEHFTRNANKIEAFFDSPANKIVKTLIDTAVLKNASDIHIEPYENVLRVRMRIDGRLIEYKSLEPELLGPLLSIIKIKGGMDTYIGMTPQSGHAKIEDADNKIDLRFSTVPTIHGEKIAIRLLYGEKGLLTKERLGFFSEDLDRINRLFLSSNGAILVTGPTGSGKSTTLYSFLAELNTEDVNIVTIEDPVENAVFGVNQININPKANLGFAEILRSVLRQDPDIIMVGEIRDSETAEIAIRAALTGHVVLATLHTNNALSAIMRLIDMGLDRFTIAHALKGVISQRLVRRICQYCKTESKVSKKDSEALGIPEEMTACHGIGCVKCGNTGYSGRFAVYEYFALDSIIRNMIEEKSSFEKLADYINNGMDSMRDNLIKNIGLGKTTVKEMYRVVF